MLIFCTDTPWTHAAELNYRKIPKELRHCSIKGPAMLIYTCFVLHIRIKVSWIKRARYHITTYLSRIFLISDSACRDTLPNSWSSAFGFTLHTITDPAMNETLEQLHLPLSRYYVHARAPIALIYTLQWISVRFCQPSSQTFTLRTTWILLSLEKISAIPFVALCGVAPGLRVKKSV